MRLPFRHKTFVPRVPPGTYDAILVGIYDVGSSFDTASAKYMPKVVLIWELVDQIHPKYGAVWAWRNYTQSVSQKSKLYEHLTSWLGGSPLQPDNDGYVDVRDFLGHPCQLEIIHTPRRGNLWQEVANVLPWPQGETRPRPRIPVASYDMQDQGIVLPSCTPSWVRRRIEASPEYREMLANTPPNSPELNRSETDPNRK